MTNDLKYVQSPPTWALKIFRWYCRPDILEDIEGDLLERYARLTKEKGVAKAKRRFILEVLMLARPNLMRSPRKGPNHSKNSNQGFIKIQIAMFRNIIKTTFRSLSKQRSYTIINTFGLTIGVASCLLIALWVNDEFKMDAFHERSDRIIQLKRVIYQDDGQNFTTNAIPQPLEIVLEESYAEVEKVSLVGWDIEALFEIGDDNYREVGRYVSPEFLEIFSFPFLAGNPSTAMAELQSILITERLAMKFFGDNWQQTAVGQTIPVGGQQLKITGVLANPPTHSTLQFDWLMPVQAYISQNSWVENWNNGGFRIVALMRPEADMGAFGEKVLQEVNNNTEGADERIRYQFFTRQYLYSNFANGAEQGGRVDFLRIMIIVGIAILTIACINFMNLATARSAKRVKEIGMRKVLGAGKNSLIFQFLMEAIVMALFAVILAVVLVQLLLPAFNELAGKSIEIDYTNPLLLLILISLALATGIMSGLYPAFFLSSFRSTAGIKGQGLKVGEGALLRKGLVVFQFMMSIVLIIGTISIYNQIGFILGKNLGLDRENVVFIPLEANTRTNYESFRTELLRISNVEAVTSSDQNPLSVGRSTGGATWDGKDPDSQVEISVLTTDHNFLETMKLELAYGTGFTGDNHRDSVSFIINERVASLMNKENPVGENLSMWGVAGKVVGVVKDFHMTSLREPIEPLIIRNDSYLRAAFIRISGNTAQTIAEMEKVVKQFNPGLPFEFTFLDDQYEQTYRSEMVVADFAKYFTLVAIFISCLGLFGLSSFTAQQRVKEIGIRKVLGAQTSNLFILLSMNFAKLILIAYVIAAPVGFYFAQNWLSQFAYKTTLGAGTFIAAGIGALLIAVATVSFKAIQAAVANPVESLKEE